MEDEHLWLRIRNHPSFFCLHIHPRTAAKLLEFFAEELQFFHVNGEDPTLYLKEEAYRAHRAADDRDAWEAEIQRR
jgi:hypothetical protein